MMLEGARLSIVYVRALRHLSFPSYVLTTDSECGARQNPLFYVTRRGALSGSYQRVSNAVYQTLDTDI